MHEQAAGVLDVRLLSCSVRAAMLRSPGFP